MSSVGSKDRQHKTTTLEIQTMTAKVELFNLHKFIFDNISHDFLIDCLKEFSWQHVQATMLEQLWNEGKIDKKTALEVLAHTDMAGWWNDHLTALINTEAA
jgi:hypothetical protein